ncbi:MAG: tetratricopeptide repeat protein, partial [Bacteroidales bacterium]
MKNRLFYLALVSFMGFFSNPLAILSQDVDAMRQLIYDYGVIGYKNVKFTKNLDSAEYYLNKALDLQYAYYDTIDDRVARNHINLASVYRRIYKNEKALEHLEKAEEILQRCDPESHLFGSIYNNKGNIIRSNYDIFRTRQYYEYALDWLIKTGNRNTNDFLAIYSNYIDILFEMREYDLAMEYLAKVDIENLILDSALEIEFHITKGANFTLLSKYDEALQHYNLAFELLKKEDVSQNIYHTSNYYRSIINYYITTGDYMSAINKVNDALSFVESLDQYSNKLKRIYHSSFNFLYANILNEQGKYERALDLIDRITSNLKIFFNEQSITDLNAKIRNENASLLPELYTLRSRVLYNLFQENNEKDILIRTHEAYIRSIKILNSTKL